MGQIHGNSWIEHLPYLHGEPVMILSSMLANSPVFLVVMSALLLALYGAFRLVQACSGIKRRPPDP